MERCLWAPEDSVDLLQASILPLGYQMTESARERVGNTTAESIRRLWRTDAIHQGREKEKKNKSRDLDKTGYKTGRDQADSKRRVGTAHRRQQQTSRGRGGN